MTNEIINEAVEATEAVVKNGKDFAGYLGAAVAGGVVTEVGRIFIKKVAKPAVANIKGKFKKEKNDAEEEKAEE